MCGTVGCVTTPEIVCTRGASHPNVHCNHAQPRSRRTVAHYSQRGPRRRGLTCRTAGVLHLRIRFRPWCRATPARLGSANPARLPVSCHENDVPAWRARTAPPYASDYASLARRSTASLYGSLTVCVMPSLSPGSCVFARHARVRSSGGPLLWRACDSAPAGLRRRLTGPRRRPTGFHSHILHWSCQWGAAPASERGAGSLESGGTSAARRARGQHSTGTPAAPASAWLAPGVSRRAARTSQGTSARFHKTPRASAGQRLGNCSIDYLQFHDLMSVMRAAGVGLFSV
jgi:hypothetical protein